MITVVEHVQQSDGDVRLTLRVAGPLPDPWEIVLPDAATGGALVVDGDVALISWSWPLTMTPPDAPAVCARLVNAQITACAARQAPTTPDGPSGLTLTEPGTVL